MTASPSASPPAIATAQQKHGMHHAVGSACWGAISQVMVRDSSVMIIFATLLGAGEMIAILTTALIDSAVCLFMIPFAYLCERLGKKRQIIAASYTGVAALVLTVAAPWTGTVFTIRSLLIGALAVYAVAYSAYIASWLPLLDGVVPKDQRGLFFGRMRFMWQLASAVFILLSGWFVGRFATVGRLQIIIALAALTLLGRIWHVRRIPETAGKPLPGWKVVFRDLLLNRSLIGFSVYLFFLYAAAGSFVPTVFVFSRTALRLPDNVVILLSAAIMSGLIVGYRGGGPLVHRYGVKAVFFITHAGFGALNFFMLFIHDASQMQFAAVAFSLAAYGVLFACASIAVSSELLALAPSYNKAVSIAFGFSLYSAGLGFSRVITSLILGSGMLADRWSVGGMVFMNYHTLFLLYGCGVLIASVLLVLVPALVRDVKRLPGL